jgi:hypothetical protein
VNNTVTMTAAQPRVVATGVDVSVLVAVTGVIHRY